MCVYVCVLYVYCMCMRVRVYLYMCQLLKNTNKISIFRRKFS